MAKKNMIVDLEKKLQRLELEKQKVQDQQEKLKAKERSLSQTIKQAQADYVTALLAQSSTSIKDLKDLLLEEDQEEENGGDS